VEVKIAEDGEILIRGDLVMSGYYNMPEETAKVLTPDGWLHTGDIGEFEGKNLKITDRKKDLLVLGNGKNIAPQPIENKMRQSPLIAEAVLLGDGMDHCAALIVPNGTRVREQLGLGEDVRLSDNDQARKAIKGELDRINKTLAPFEMVKKFALLDQAFSVETGELTPTLKVKRKAVREKYASVIETLL
jgi:long-chain acyl-CoA synthetase